MAATPRRTICTFSCDIAPPVSPTRAAFWKSTIANALDGYQRRMHFNEALRIAAHRLGLAERPDARLSPLAAPIALGAALMVLSALEPVLCLLGAALWLYVAAAV